MHPRLFAIFVIVVVSTCTGITTTAKAQTRTFWEMSPEEFKLYLEQVRIWRAEALKHSPILAELERDKVAIFYKDNNAHLINYHAVKFQDADLKKLSGVKRLHTLSLENSDVTADGLKHLEAVPSLNELWLFGCKKLSDEDLTQLPKLPKLQVLILNGTKIRDEGLRELHQLSSLKVLFLYNTRISDAGLKHLKRIPNLTLLDLEHTSVTDDGLAQLADFPKLKRVHVGPGISDAAINSLKKAVPDLEIFKIE